jgi:transcription elongation factor GreA
MEAQVIYLTSEGLVKLQGELKNLKDVKRIEIAEKLKEAISFWDLSENAEYEEARNEQAQVEKKILDLEEQLKHVEIITEESHKAWRVWMGAEVEISLVWEKEKETYLIVWTTEADILATPPKISNDSPIGKALMGKKKWQKVKVKAPAGTLEYEINSLK